MEFSTSPYLLKDTSVRRVMTQVLLALVPGIVAYALLIGPGILAQIAIATLTALAAEAAMLRLRDKPLALFLGDGSAVVTAWLVALTFPPVAPWWLTVVGVLFAIVVAKHRSEERRVGKECMIGWRAGLLPYHEEGNS